MIFNEMIHKLDNFLLFIIEICDVYRDFAVDWSSTWTRLYVLFNFLLLLDNLLEEINKVREEWK
jgi:hypothetical protein